MQKKPAQCSGLFCCFATHFCNCNLKHGWFWLRFGNLCSKIDCFQLKFGCFQMENWLFLLEIWQYFVNEQLAANELFAIKQIIRNATTTVLFECGKTRELLLQGVHVFQGEGASSRSCWAKSTWTRLKYLENSPLFKGQKSLEFTNMPKRTTVN